MARQTRQGSTRARALAREKKNRALRTNPPTTSLRDHARRRDARDATAARHHSTRHQLRTNAAGRRTPHNNTALTSGPGRRAHDAASLGLLRSRPDPVRTGAIADDRTHLQAPQKNSAPQPGAEKTQTKHKKWRRGRDSNPRYPFEAHTLSKRARSAAPSPLRKFHRSSHPARPRCAPASSTRPCSPHSLAALHLLAARRCAGRPSRFARRCTRRARRSSLARSSLARSSLARSSLARRSPLAALVALAACSLRCARFGRSRLGSAALALGARGSALPRSLWALAARLCRARLGRGLSAAGLRTAAVASLRSPTRPTSPRRRSGAGATNIELAAQRASSSIATNVRPGARSAPRSNVGGGE